LRPALPPLILLAAAVATIFFPALNAPLLYDDLALQADPALQSSSGWLDVWRFEQSRPLTWFTFWVNGQFGGYHLFNILIHLAACLLLLDTAPRLVPRLPGVLAAFLFAAHPFAVEPAAYVFARATALATALCLGVLCLWSRGRHWLAVPCFALALLAKEETAAFPVLLAMLHASSSRNRAERAPIAVMLVAALAAVLRVAFLTAIVPGSGAGPQAGISWSGYAMTQGVVIPGYLLQLVWPAGLSADHAVRPAGMEGLLGWAALVLACILARRRREGFWLMAGLVLLLPTSSVFPAQDLAADRRMYLPMTAFCLALGMVLARLPKFVWILPLVLLGAVSFQRTRLWSDEAALWRDAVSKAPGKLAPALRLARAVPPADALDILNKLDAGDARVHTETGRIHLVANRPSDALASFGRAAGLEPRNAIHYVNRGVALSRLGLTMEAVREWRQALELSPCQPQAVENLMRLGEVVTPACVISSRALP
jgi:tetratricopeptide (TPR) repeat protein